MLPTQVKADFGSWDTYMKSLDIKQKGEPCTKVKKPGGNLLEYLFTLPQICLWLITHGQSFSSAITALQTHHQSEILIGTKMLNNCSLPGAISSAVLYTLCSSIYQRITLTEWLSVTKSSPFYPSLNHNFTHILTHFWQMRVEKSIQKYHNYQNEWWELVTNSIHNKLEVFCFWHRIWGILWINPPPNLFFTDLFLYFLDCFSCFLPVACTWFSI